MVESAACSSIPMCHYNEKKVMFLQPYVCIWVCERWMYRFYFERFQFYYCYYHYFPRLAVFIWVAVFMWNGNNSDFWCVLRMKIFCTSYHFLKVYVALLGYSHTKIQIIIEMPSLLFFLNLDWHFISVLMVMCFLFICNTFAVGFFPAFCALHVPSFAFSFQFFHQLIFHLLPQKHNHWCWCHPLLFTCCNT